MIKKEGKSRALNDVSHIHPRGARDAPNKVAEYVITYQKVISAKHL